MFAEREGEPFGERLSLVSFTGLPLVRNFDFSLTFHWPLNNFHWPCIRLPIIIKKIHVYICLGLLCWPSIFLSSFWTSLRFSWDFVPKAFDFTNKSILFFFFLSLSGKCICFFSKFLNHFLKSSLFFLDDFSCSCSCLFLFSFWLDSCCCCFFFS